MSVAFFTLPICEAAKTVPVSICAMLAVAAMTPEGRDVRIASGAVGMRYAGHARRVWRATWGTVAGVLSALMAVWVARGMPSSGGGKSLGGAVFAAMILLVIPALGSALAALLALKRFARPGLIQANADGVTAHRGGVRVEVPREQIADGTVVPTTRGARVELRRTNGNVLTADVASVGEGESVLSAVGLDAQKRTMEATLGGGGRAIGVGFGAGFSTFTVVSMMLQAIPRSMHGVVATLGFVASIVVASLVAWLLRPTRLVVGTDGISLRSSVRTRFIAYSELASVDVVAAPGKPLVLRFLDGRTEQLACALGEDERRALAMRVAQARAAGSDADASSLAQLDRGARSLEAWRAELRALVRAPAHLRVASLPVDELYRVLDDPEAPADRRVGAALAAIEASEPGAASERIRVVAESCANPAARAALDALARGEEPDEVMLEALAKR